jgi:hypothetical protein
MGERPGGHGCTCPKRAGICLGLWGMGTSVLGIYTCSKQARHAVRMQVSVEGDGCGSAVGMMIELSMQGCRISRIDAATIKPGTQVSVTIEGYGAVPAEVLRAHDGLVGLRFVRPLTRSGLIQILESDREPPLQIQPVLRFGT